MKRIPTILTPLLLTIFVQLLPANSPNILVIFTDDQGYGDLACYGNPNTKTPRLDQLAKEGTRFTSFYTQTVCGPSRSALLTGRYPCRSKGWGMPASEITFGELMREKGYQTACIGKWDVSNRKAIIDRMPNAQGFDYYFGALGANDGGGVKFHENNKAAGSSRDMGELTTLYTDKSIEFLKEKRDPKKPFVLYLAHTMMHTIIDASDRFRGKSKFYTWVYSISVNMTLNFLKKRNRYWKISLDDVDRAIELDEEFIEQTSKADIIRECNIHELQSRLNEALMQLTDDHRAVVIMFDIQGMAHADIAKILRISAGTVRSRLYYAHRQLQNCLEEFRN